MKLLFELFITFAKLGAVTFGGGYAMLPIIQREIVEKKKWASEEEILDYYAVGQCTPGVIAVNTATFIGQKKKGVLGGITATLGVVFPSLIIITVIAAFIANFADNPVVKNAFAGIRVCVGVLIVNAIIKLWKKSVIDVLAFIIFFAVTVLSFVFSISPIIYVVSAALIGITAKNMEARKK
jgi:chromate transporter